MAFIPQFKLYQSDGATLLYHLEYIITTNYPNENPSSVQLSNLRSSKGIIIPGGNKNFELSFGGVLIGTDYTNLQTKIATMKSTILANTPYVLKIDTSVSSTDDINVTRVSPIIFEESRRTKFQYYTINLLGNSW